MTDAYIDPGREAWELFKGCRATSRSTCST